MRNSIFVLLLTAIGFYQSGAQGLQREVLSSSGSYTSAPGIQLSWTLSEPFHSSRSGSSVRLNEGFEQILIGPVTSHENELLEGDLHVFPNPFTSAVQLSIGLPDLTKAELTIYDFQGKIFHRVSTIQNRMTIGSETWPSGLYVIQLSDDQGLRIIKKISKL